MKGNAKRTTLVEHLRELMPSIGDSCTLHQATKNGKYAVSTLDVTLSQLRSNAVDPQTGRSYCGPGGRMNIKRRKLPTGDIRYERIPLEVSDEILGRAYRAYAGAIDSFAQRLAEMDGVIK